MESVEDLGAHKHIVLVNRVSELLLNTIVGTRFHQMSKTATKPATPVRIAAATSMAIAGALEFMVLMMIQINEVTVASIFALVGAAQLFFAATLILGWASRTWHYIRIGGNALFIILWLGSSIPSGRIGQGGNAEGIIPVNAISIVILIFEFAALLLSIRLLQTARTPSARKSTENTGHGAAA